MGACCLQKRSQTPFLLSGNLSSLSVPVLHVNLPCPEVFTCRCEVRVVPFVASVLVTGSCWIILPTFCLCRIDSSVMSWDSPHIGLKPCPIAHTCLSQLWLRSSAGWPRSASHRVRHVSLSSQLLKVPQGTGCFLYFFYVSPDAGLLYT